MSICLRINAMVMQGSLPSLSQKLAERTHCVRQSKMTREQEHHLIAHSAYACAAGPCFSPTQKAAEPVLCLQVANIDSRKRDAELTRWRGAPPHLHVLVHSLQQIPRDLVDTMLPTRAPSSHSSAADARADGTFDSSAAGGHRGDDAALPRVIFRTDGPAALARGTPRPEEDRALFEHIRRCVMLPAMPGGSHDSLKGVQWCLACIPTCAQRGDKNNVHTSPFELAQIALQHMLQSSAAACPQVPDDSHRLPKPLELQRDDAPRPRPDCTCSHRQRAQPRPPPPPRPRARQLVAHAGALVGIASDRCLPLGRQSHHRPATAPLAQLGCSDMVS
jgi:hypothetical protein